MYVSADRSSISALGPKPRRYSPCKAEEEVEDEDEDEEEEEVEDTQVYPRREGEPAVLGRDSVCVCLRPGCWYGCSSCRCIRCCCCGC